MEERENTHLHDENAREEEETNVHAIHSTNNKPIEFQCSTLEIKFNSH